MQTCPACGTPVLDGRTACDKCQLSVALFDPVREAVGVPRSDPQYLGEMQEILAVLDKTLPDSKGPSSGTAGRISQPARFPTTPRPRSADDVPTTPTPRVGLPALPPGHGAEAWRSQIDEYLRLGRRRGTDMTEFASRARPAIETDDAGALEVLNRDLFVSLAATLTEELERVSRRREELARWVTTASIDTELDSARGTLTMGDLSGADRRLRRLTDEIDLLEEEWETIQILITGAELIRDTIQELGGDATPALGPLEEGRRLGQAGRRVESSSLLAHANVALWSVLAPLLTRDLGRLKEIILEQRTKGTDVTEAAVQLREIAVHLRHRNFGALISAYRRLRSLADPWQTVVAPMVATIGNGENSIGPV